MVVESNNPVLIKVAGGREIALRPETIFGRQAECDVLLTEGHASRRHAKLLLNDEGAWLEDLGSANGTFINGSRITGKARLNSGDRLRFDVEEFDFRMPMQAAPVASMPLPMMDENNNKTMYRAPDSAPVVAAASSGVFKRPGAWADPDAMGDGGSNKTRFIDPAQMKQMVNNAPIIANPSAVDGPHLQVVSGSRTGLNIRMAVGDSGNAEWTIGSQSDREVQFQDSGVSALHAKIVNEGERWKVLDQMSANGTFVNGKRSTVSYLASGDRVRFGPVECIFHADGAGNLRPITASRLSVPGLDEEPKGKSFVIAAAAFLATIAVLFVVYKFLL